MPAFSSASQPSASGRAAKAAAGGRGARAPHPFQAHGFPEELVVRFSLEHARKQLRARLTSEKFSEGEFVFHQGDDGDKMYLITSGEVEVLQRAEQDVQPLLQPTCFQSKFPLRNVYKC